MERKINWFGAIHEAVVGSGGEREGIYLEESRCYEVIAITYLANLFSAD